MRDLARQAGISHAAPPRHFTDRKALLDALVEAGFARLGLEVRRRREDCEARLRAPATAYARFAAEDAALMDLMFTPKNAGNSASAGEVEHACSPSSAT